MKDMLNRAVKVMSFSKFDANSTLIYKNLDIMPLKKRLLFNSCIYIYKTLHSLTSYYSRDYFKYKTCRSNSRTSNEYDLEIPFTRLTVFTNTIFIKGVKLYNNIECKIRSANKLSLFISNFKKSLNENFNNCNHLLYYSLNIVYNIF